MTRQPDRQFGPVPKVVYQIRVSGHLDRERADWLAAQSVRLEESGETVFTVETPDQAALHGLIRKLRDLGIGLISVNPVAPPEEIP